MQERGSECAQYLFGSPGDYLVEYGQAGAQKDALYRGLFDDIWGFNM